MRRPHLLRVADPIESFSALVERACAAGLRVGWLGLEEPPMPPVVDAIVATGVSQCVLAGRRQTLTARARRGPPVLEDLLRQHFLGCDVVLVHGQVDLPALERGESGWRVTSIEGRQRQLGDDQLLAAFRRASW